MIYINVFPSLRLGPNEIKIRKGNTYREWSSFCFSKLLYHSITMKPCPFHNMPRLEIIYVRYCYICALVITFKHNGGSFWRARWCGPGLIWRDGCTSDQDRVISLVEVVVNLDLYGIRTIGDIIFKHSVVIESIKTTSMEIVRTWVLEKIKSNIWEVMIMPKNDMMYQDIYNCICEI